MKIFFIGCVEFSYISLRTLITRFHTQNKLEIVGVATKEHSAFNADFCNLAPLCEESHIPFIYTKDINSPATLDFIHSCKPSVIYCFGWSSLIKKELLNAYPIVGYHPAALPHNRGRHPIIWALVLGLKQSASTFFLMEEGADSGAIISQVPFNINFKDNAKSLCEKVESIAQKQICDFTAAILSAVENLKNIAEFEKITPKNNSLEKNQPESASQDSLNLAGGGAIHNSIYAQALFAMATPQNHSIANLWRKRGVRDGVIDFRMSAVGIYNLIRALSQPYVGAEVVYNGKHYKVWEAKIVKVDLPNIESGKVLRVDSQGVLIKAYDDAILLTQHEFDTLPKEGDYF